MSRAPAIDASIAISASEPDRVAGVRLGGAAPSAVAMAITSLTLALSARARQLSIAGPAIAVVRSGGSGLGGSHWLRMSNSLGVRAGCRLLSLSARRNASN